jgi:hypothetical protein
MSASGHFRKSALVTDMSAFPPIATKMRTSLEVRFVPFADKREYRFRRDYVAEFQRRSVSRDQRSAKSIVDARRKHVDVLANALVMV